MVKQNGCYLSASCHVATCCNRCLLCALIALVFRDGFMCVATWQLEAEQLEEKKGNQL